MRDQGRSKGFVVLVWTVTAVVLAASVLASLADTLMPDAYRVGGKRVAFATAAGFFVSFMLAEL